MYKNNIIFNDEDVVELLKRLDYNYDLLKIHIEKLSPLLIKFVKHISFLSFSLIYNLIIGEKKENFKKKSKVNLIKTSNIYSANLIQTEIC